MASFIDNAICIRTWDYSETSQTVSLFGREHGMIRGLAKGARREKGKFSGGFDVLTRGQVVAIIKRSADLANLIEWDLQQIFWSIRNRLEAHRVALYFADLVHHLVTDHDPHPELFDALLRSLEAIEANEPAGEIALRFHIELLRAVGYLPEFAHDAHSGAALPQQAETLAFAPDAGGVVADTGAADRWRVRRSTVECIRAALDDEGDGAGRDRTLDAQTLDRANRLLAAYIRHIIGREPPTMSLLFPDLRV